MLTIISYNLNGIRAAIRKGFLQWLATYPADIVCVQETKATQGDVDVTAIEALGYHHYWYSANKKGYSSVAVFTKLKPTNVIYGTGHKQSDFEGRVIQLEFEKFTLINAYFPSGTSGEVRQAYKYQWLSEINTHIDIIQKKQKNIILVGDYNIAHTEIDIHDPKGNKKNSGFLPEEREWFTSLLSNGWVDTLRAIKPTDTGLYSWWSQRIPSVRLENKGWRIDYICCSTPLQQYLVDATILPHIIHSDHCPVLATFNL